MRLHSLVWLENNDYVIEIACASGGTEKFVITVMAISLRGDNRFHARVPDTMTRCDIYRIVGKFHRLRVGDATTEAGDS